MTSFSSTFNRKVFRTLPRFIALILLVPSGAAVPQTTVAPPAAVDGKPTFVVPEIKPEMPLKIVAYGDMRFTDPANVTDTNPRVRKWLAEKIGSEKPDLLF